MTQSRRKATPHRQLPSPAFVVGAGILLVLGAAVAMELWNSWTDVSGAPEGATTVSGSPLPDGPAQAAGVEVSQPVADAGRIALNTPVQRLWRLHNSGTTAVSIGRPSIEVLEGC